MGIYTNNLKNKLQFIIMDKYLYVLRASWYHFRRGFETLYEGFKDPEKFKKVLTEIFKNKKQKTLKNLLKISILV